MKEVQIDKYQIQKDPKLVFNTLVDVYTERLYFHIRKMLGNHEDADDALQHTFIKVWQNLAKFKGDAHIYTWIHRIASNEALMVIRKRKIHQEIDASNEQSSPSYIDHSETVNQLNLAILQLPEKQKKVFELRYYQDLSYKEISKQLKTTEGALKASYHHAVKKIEVFLLNN